MKRKSVRLQITTQRVIRKVRFIDGDRINHTRLAERLTELVGQTISRPLVSHWIATGDVPAKYVPYIRQVNFLDVISTRKPTTKRSKSEPVKAAV